jgi:hypothetical protein
MHGTRGETDRPWRRDYLGVGVEFCCCLVFGCEQNTTVQPGIFRHSTAQTIIKSNDECRMRRLEIGSDLNIYTLSNLQQQIRHAASDSKPFANEFPAHTNKLASPTHVLSIRRQNLASSTYGGGRYITLARSHKGTGRSPRLRVVCTCFYAFDRLASPS